MFPANSNISSMHIQQEMVYILHNLLHFVRFVVKQLLFRGTYKKKMFTRKTKNI